MHGLPGFLGHVDRSIARPGCGIVRVVGDENGLKGLPELLQIVAPEGKVLLEGERLHGDKTGLRFNDEGVVLHDVLRIEVVDFDAAIKGEDRNFARPERRGRDFGAEYRAGGSKSREKCESQSSFFHF